MELTTQRLILRPVTPGDVPRIVELAGDAAVAEMTGAIPHPLTVADVEAWLASSQSGGHTFAITRQDDREFLGVVSLSLAKESGVKESGVKESGRPPYLGYWVGRPYWGQGFATEAVRRVLRFAFGEMKLSEIEAGVFPGNDASIKVLTQTGFRETGHGMRPAPARGGDREVALFVATRASFAQAVLSQAVGRS